MHLKSIVRLALVLSLTTGGLSMFRPAGAETAAPSQAETKAYFLHIDGRALPLKQALVNGVNVLGGAVISLSLPVNISGYTKAGVNTLKVDYVSDPKSNLNVIVEKRTPGPKTEEIAKISISADDSKGETKSSSISFNLPADGGNASVGELSDADREAISREFERYYEALAKARAGQLRSLYRPSLADQRKLSPESARFYENVIARESAILKHKELRLPPINKDGLAFKVEGDIVKLYRKDSKPLIESNEVQAKVAPLLIEVDADKKGKGRKNKTKPAPLKSKPDQDIEIPSSAFKPDSERGAERFEVKDSNGNIIADEIAINNHAQVFDGAMPAEAIPPKSNEPPVRTDVKERIVRFNLYFKPAKPAATGKRVWVISLPPNV